MSFQAAITGIGAVTPFGAGTQALWNGLLSGQDCFHEIAGFDCTGQRTRIGAEVRSKTDPALHGSGPCRLARVDFMAMEAAEEAMDQAGLQSGNKAGTAVVAATAGGAIRELEIFFNARARGKACDPVALLTSYCLSSIGTNLARKFMLGGPRLTLATVCSSSSLALAAGMEMLRCGKAEQVLVVGAETLSMVTHGGFNSLRAVAPDRCRPFSVNRKGLILGEGAGAILMESCSSARQRGARIQGFLSGYGLVTDTYHFTAPDPKGRAAAAAIHRALEDAQIEASGIGYVNAHGTGTKLNDSSEAAGLALVFGNETPLVSSSKSMIGHLLGAAGIVEAVATVLSLKEEKVHPSANLDVSIPGCKLNLVTKEVENRPAKAAVSNSFAFGGSNISLVFERRQTDSPGAERNKTGRTEPVCITGLGLITPFGIGTRPFIQGVVSGRSALSCLEAPFRKEEKHLGGIADFSAARSCIPAAKRRQFNRIGTFAALAADQALESAGLTAEEMPDAPMTFGTAFGCSSNVHNFYSEMLESGPEFALPKDFMLSVSNAPLSMYAQWKKLSGPLWVFVGNEGSFEDALGWGALQIRTGKAERVLVTAAEELSEVILIIHDSLGFFSKRSPLLLGEGAVSAVLESESAAKRRKAEILGRILGRGTGRDLSCGPQDFSGDPSLMLQAIEKSLSGRALSENVAVQGTENGLHESREFDARLQKEVTELGPIFPGPRMLCGDSGFGGGLGLAAALLCPPGPERKDRGEDHLILTNSRGGLLHALLVRREA